MGRSHVEEERRRDGGTKPPHAEVRPVAHGFLLGAAPVAETFPDPLSTLEQELWVPPLRVAISEALKITGSVSPRALRRSPVVTTVRGRVVADLDLLGLGRQRSRILSRLDPRPPSRRLRAAWRVGRLKIAFPALAGHLVERTDQELEAVGAPCTLDDVTLLRILRRAPRLLVALHAHEVLAGMLLPGGPATAASVALRALAAARADGLDDDDAVAGAPVTLALLPPAIGKPAALPPVPPMPSLGPVAAPGTEAAELREALRLRARWVHELTARVAIELGERATLRGALRAPEHVRHLTLRELQAALGGELVLLDLGDRTDPAADDSPLPAAFRLTPAGEVLPADEGGAPGEVQGIGVAPGRGVGPVHVGEDWPPDGAVLVVRSLDPRLAAYLPVLSGVVSETGTAMSHVAIVARELGVPAVVGVAGATTRFADGDTVVIDGDTGEVRVLDEAGAP